MGANPQHGVGPARQPIAWCWCFCCKRRLELFESRVRDDDGERTFACCGRSWKVGEAQPPALHEGQGAELEDLRDLAREALDVLEDVARRPYLRGLGEVAARATRKPYGLKGLLRKLRARVTPGA